ALGERAPAPRPRGRHPLPGPERLRRPEQGTRARAGGPRTAVRCRDAARGDRTRAGLSLPLWRRRVRDRHLAPAAPGPRPGALAAARHPPGPDSRRGADDLARNRDLGRPADRSAPRLPPARDPGRPDPPREPPLYP